MLSFAIKTNSNSQMFSDHCIANVIQKIAQPQPTELVRTQIDIPQSPMAGPIHTQSEA